MKTSLILIIALFIQTSALAKSYNTNSIGLDISKSISNKDYKLLENLLMKYSNNEFKDTPNIIFKIKSYLKHTKGNEGVSHLLYRPYIKNKYEEVFYSVKYSTGIIFIKITTIDGLLKNFSFNTGLREILGTNTDIYNINKNTKEDSVANFIEKTAVASGNLHSFYKNLSKEMVINVKLSFPSMLNNYKIINIKQSIISYSINPIEQRTYYIETVNNNTITKLSCEINMYNNKSLNKRFINDFNCMEI